MSADEFAAREAEWHERWNEALGVEFDSVRARAEIVAEMESTEPSLCRRFVKGKGLSPEQELGLLALARGGKRFESLARDYWMSSCDQPEKLRMLPALVEKDTQSVVRDNIRNGVPVDNRAVADRRSTVRVRDWDKAGQAAAVRASRDARGAPAFPRPNGHVVQCPECGCEFHSTVNKERERTNG